MKKLISILIAIIIFTTTLVGCTTGTQADTNTRDYTTQGKETKLIPDENATGELTVSWCGGNWVIGGSTYHNAIEIFKKLYPNVKVTFDFADLAQAPPGGIDDFMTEYYKKLQTKIMAGSGPDVFELSDWDMDINKIMQSGVLADMYDFIENDPYFNPDDYNQAILKSGQYNGEQYVIPRVYMIPFFMTTKEIASIIEYDDTKKMDYYESWDYLLHAKEEHKEEFSNEDFIGNMAIVNRFPFTSGVNYINRQESKSNFDTKEFKKAVEKQKEVLKVYPFVDMVFSGPNAGVNELERKEIAMWSFNYDGLNPILQNIRRLGIDKSVIIPFRDINKKLQADILYNVAMSESSKNKENAYRFIKILISEEVSGRYDENLGVISSAIPISNTATKKLLEQAMQDEIMLHEDGGNYEYSKTKGASQEFVDDFLALLNDIDGVLLNAPTLKLIQEAFKPYFDDEMSYEKCLETARDAVDIYLSE